MAIALDDTPLDQARVAPTPHDDVVVDAEIEEVGALHELAREANVLASRSRIAARMVVQQDHGRRASSHTARRARPASEPYVASISRATATASLPRLPEPSCSASSSASASAVGPLKYSRSRGRSVSGQRSIVIAASTACLRHSA